MMGWIHRPGFFVVMAGLAGAFIFGRELERKGAGNLETAYTMLMPAFLVAYCGAKLDGILDDLQAFDTDPRKYLLSLNGHAWYGAFLGGLAACYLMGKRRGIPTKVLLDALAPAMMAGYAMGRIGCHVTGDGCYGIPTTLPWGVRYPHGLVPTNQVVHPTPLYEAGAALLIFSLLWWLRKKDPAPGMLFSICITLYSLERFLVEFIRRNPRYGPFTQAQWISIALFGAGLAGLILGCQRKRSPPQEEGRTSPEGKPLPKVRPF